LALAGLYDDWTSPEGQPIGTCAIITADANELMRPIHHRMPVILPTAHHALWLDPTIADEALLRPLLRPCPSEAMEADEVSPLVNAPRHHAPTGMAPVPLG
jgi:putative SOS response-associated peptidase YedK